jgi:hypothetical protein
MVDQRHLHERPRVQSLRRSLKLHDDMIIRIRNLLVASVLSLFAGLGPAHGQMGANGPPPPPGGGGQPGGIGGPGMSGREFGPPTDFNRIPGPRTPVQDWPQPGRPGSPPSRTPGREGELDISVPLGDAVSLVQERYNATAVKTDTVREGGQLVYRIRLLSADKSRVWTVSVDARTGRIN